MPKIMTRFLSKLMKSASKETDKSQKDHENNSSTKSNVNEEYLKAFRSNSYEEIWDKVHGQLGYVTTTSTVNDNNSNNNNNSSTTGVSSSSLSSPFYLDLSEDLLEPRQETLKTMFERLKFHRLLIEYFEASLRACNICELLLRSINQIRSDYRKIKRVIKISERVLLMDHQVLDLDNNYNNVNNHDRYLRALFRELRAIALLKNPFSVISPSQFCDIRDSYVALFHRLTLKGKEMKRRERVNKGLKRVGGVVLVIAHSALLVALLIFAVHSVFGIVAAPALLGCSSVNYLRTKKKNNNNNNNDNDLGRFLGDQFDLAARGMFIVINDFDTMCQMARRLQDEIEHRKSLAEICIRNGKFEVLKEVVKELSDQDSSFLEQLEELEGHIYLSLLTINRSRRLVIQEIIATCP